MALHIGEEHSTWLRKSIAVVAVAENILEVKTVNSVSYKQLDAGAKGGSP